HAGLESVEPGRFLEAALDLVLGNDITAPPAIREFRKMGARTVFDPGRVALVPDHFAPNKDIKAAEQCACMRAFAREQGVTNYFEVGQMGIEHALLPERGLVLPGDLVVGADSHTCTYGAVGAFSTGVGSTDMAAGMAMGRLWFRVPEAIRVHLDGEPVGWAGGKDLVLSLIGRIGVDGALNRSLEYQGPGVGTLTMEERFTVANMAVEAGAVNGIFPVDEAARAWAASVSDRKYAEYAADPDAVYVREIRIDLGDLRPVVAFPHLPSNVRPASESGTVPVDQVVIGSCTNGRIEDLRIAAYILRGRRVARGLRCIILPATQKVYLQAVREGLAEDFVEAGAAISTPTCGPCLGGHMGILAAGERAVATTNRNFVGRMGHTESEIYLAGPAVAAASAVAGRICDPSEILPAPTRARLLAASPDWPRTSAVLGGGVL
ncbi:MAG TPA: 3-isopropylmalate dehydratase large subunit, partial [Magnetospirillaceae bacterium]|nr:3-isopropylmalate dehydratase large subunit [Magnetospirillaceae bacterium]